MVLENILRSWSHMSIIGTKLGSPEDLREYFCHPTRKQPAQKVHIWAPVCGKVKRCSLAMSRAVRYVTMNHTGSCVCVYINLSTNTRACVYVRTHIHSHTLTHTHTHTHTHNDRLCAQYLKKSCGTLLWHQMGTRTNGRQSRNGFKTGISCVYNCAFVCAS